MQISIGQKIRELRLHDNRTQTEVAEALGVSPQAVSRWEMGSTYPDLELLPSIAQYFGTSIDGLFGFQSEREGKINAVIQASNQERDVDKRLTLLRNAMVEFPGNEKIMYELAAALSEAGWTHLHEHLRYNDDGYIVHEIERHAENFYWSESVKLFETILSESKDPQIINDSTYNLTLLYCNLGQYAKGLALAERMPLLAYSKELMRSYAVDGKDRHRYHCESLLILANTFAEQMVYALMSKKSNFGPDADGKSDLPVRMLSGTIAVFDLLFEDGNMGPYHSLVSDLYCYLAEHQWRAGMRDEAFVSLDKGLSHAKRFDALANLPDENPVYTSPLLNGISMNRKQWQVGETAAHLSEHWPIWVMPEYDDIYAEITADPRWADWVRRTKEE